jgi:hypothetical protein
MISPPANRSLLWSLTELRGVREGGPVVYLRHDISDGLPRVTGSVAGTVDWLES